MIARRKYGCAETARAEQLCAAPPCLEGAFTVGGGAVPLESRGRAAAAAPIQLRHQSVDLDLERDLHLAERGDVAEHGGADVERAGDDAAAVRIRVVGVRIAGRSEAAGDAHVTRWAVLVLQQRGVGRNRVAE